MIWPFRKSAVHPVQLGPVQRRVDRMSGMRDMSEDTKPAPDVQKAVPNIKAVAGQYHMTGQLEIAGPIDAPVISLTPWVICLKSASQLATSVRDRAFL
jgi:hypothetical protein